jgi:C-methyltransferase C-terminal domain/Putative zinc binding domain/Methyltransferase domain
VGSPACRSCSGRSGHLVLDLGSQPACDHFPKTHDRGPDPDYPLEMWLCSSCGLAQLIGEPTMADEPRGAEPDALVAQAVDAVQRLATRGWLSGRSRVVEFPSPHGGSWLGLLSDRGLPRADDDARADLVIDSFGMMHDPDQSGALAARAERLAPGGVLLLQYHSLDTIIRLGQWNALRHGHFAYYSTSALVGMLEANGLNPRFAWRFDLYGGTVLLAASREPGRDGAPDDSVQALLSDEAHLGVRDHAVVGRLQDHAEAHVRALRNWLVGQRAAGRRVLGYGAASRAVALLCRARVDQQLLPAIADSSPSKHGRRMPGTDIPIIAPAALAAEPPDAVLLFVPDLLPEVRRDFPQVEESGGRWVDADALHA